MGQFNALSVRRIRRTFGPIPFAGRFLLGFNAARPF